MELLNVSFAILLIKIMLGALPFFGGVAYCFTREEGRREIRNTVCSGLFGVANAIPFAKFNRFMVGLSIFAIIFGLLMLWLLVVLPML